MMGKTHIIIGLSYGIPLLPIVNEQITPTDWGLLMVGLTLGSLLPDIDHPQSVIARKAPLVGWIASKLTGHRSFFHSIVGVAVWLVVLGILTTTLSGTLNVLGWNVEKPLISCAAGLMIGYVLHIIADMFTLSGVKLFYPIKKTIGFPIFVTGGYGELFLRWGLIIIGIIQVIGFFTR